MITSVSLQYAKALFDLGNEKHLENEYYDYLQMVCNILNENKDRIQDNVDNSTDNCSHHTDLGKSLSCNEGIHAQYDQYKKASEDIDSGIICCIS